MTRIFEWLWRRYLVDWKGRPCRVVRIKGWNVCTYDSPSGQRTHATFLPDWACAFGLCGREEFDRWLESR